MRGITYYPQLNKDKTIQENLQSIEVKELENQNCFEDKWEELISLEYGDRYFVINKNMYDFTKQMIEEVKQGQLKTEDFLYNYPKLFDLFSCCSYLKTTYKNNRLKDLDDDFLMKFLDDIVLSGVNLEEFKMIVLAGNLLNIDPMLKRNDDSSILKSRYEFTNNVVDLIDMYRKFMPYTYYSRKVEQYSQSLIDEKFLMKVTKEFDKNMLKNLSQNRIKNGILKTIFKVRTYDDKTIKYLMKLPFLNKIFTKRQNENADDLCLPEMFKYQICDNALYLIDAICKSKVSEDISTFEKMYKGLKKEELISKEDFNDYKKAKKELYLLEREYEDEKY